LTGECLLPVDACSEPRQRVKGLGHVRALTCGAAFWLLTTPCWAEPGDKLDRSRLAPTFGEEFNHPISYFNPQTGTGRWKTNYDFGWQEGASSRTLAPEMQVYSDAAYNGIGPFTERDGALEVTAARNPRPSDPTNGGKPYTSGLLTTSQSFQQRYGYFEMRAALPQGPGLWPAFWLAVPFDLGNSAPQYPGEIDVMEMLGKEPGTIYDSMHWPLDAAASRQAFQTVPVQVGNTSGFRTYGVLWTEQALTWFVDDTEVLRLPNPGLHRPMMILANLAVGGNWGGPPDATTTFPAVMRIAYIHAFSVDR